MDFRRDTNYRPEQSLRESRSRSPYAPSSFGQSVENSRRQQPAYGAAQIGEGLTYNQVRKASPPKDDAEISQQIEQRHEELKRQIALKEKQLANMTGERDTVDRLKQRLGLQTQGRSDAGARFGQGKLEEDSRRGVFPTSVSPNTRPVAKMVGLRSTYAHRQGFADSLNDRKDHQAEIQDDQQLEFNPTRQARPQRTSPLRGSHSRSKSREAAAPNYTLNTSIASFANHNLQSQNLQGAGAQRYTYPAQQKPYEQEAYQSHQQREKTNSPLRQKSPTQDYSNTSSAIIRPQPVENVNSTRAFTAAAHTAGTGANQHPGYSYGGSFTNGGPALQPREQLYRDRVEAMRVDNESLQRRLNQVSKELERIVREKDDTARNLQQTEGDVRHMENIVNSKDDVDTQNQILRDELAMLKESNAGLDSKLKHEEMDTANTGGRVVATTADKNNLEIDKNNMERDLTGKFQQLDSLTREQTMVQQKLNIANNELEMINRESGQLNNDNQEWTEQIQRIQNEKGDLLRQVETLTIQYDNTVRNISGDRRNMDSSNDWQTKILLAKIMFNQLETFQKDRTQNSFTEMVEYSKFDGDCHQKLRSFANCIYKIGSQKQTKALNIWYTNALRPLQTRKQNSDIAMVIDCNKLQAKVFYAWKQHQRDRLDSYHFRTAGIQRFWHILAKGSKQELKRAMDIWKQKLGFQAHAVTKLRALVKKRNDVNMRQAVYAWRHYSLTMEHACRIRILQMETTQKMFMSQVWQQMRWILRDQKRKRQRMLNQYVKAWKDGINYNRHLLQTNMAAIAFGQHNRKYLLHNIFNELRHHRERSKYELTSRAVKDEVDVAIAEAQAFNADKQYQVTRKHQNRAGNMIRDAFGKRLHSYFAKWRDHTLSYKQTMNIKVKSRIIHMYNNYMNSYFDHWKKNAHIKAGKHRAALGDSMMEQNEKLQNEVLEGEKQLRIHAEAVRTSKRRTVDKTFRKLFYRRLSTAMGRWRGICHFRQGQEDRAALVVKRMRKRFIRQAFDRYLEFFRTHQQRGRNEKSADHIRETLNKRTLRKHFDAVVFYTQRHKRSKRYWNKILGKMDKFMKQRAVTIWAENAHLTHALLLESQQHGHTSDIRDMTEEMGKHHLSELEQEAALKEHDRKRTTKAHRQIGNYFLRNYSSQTSAMFTTWKRNVQEQVHKEKLLKRTLDHWRKSQLEAVRRVFRKFLSDDRAREHRAKIKQSMIEQEEHRLSIENNQNIQQGRRDGHGDTTSVHRVETDELSRKILHTMECMERRNQVFLCFSRKRMLFNGWRKAGKQQRALCHAISNVLEKSMYKKGFVYIHEQMRDHSYTERVHRITKRFAARFFKVNGSDAFTKWKHWGLSKVAAQKEERQGQLQAKNQAFEDYHAKVREHNAARCFKFLLGGRTSDVWRAWANVIRITKLTKAKGVEFSTRQTELRTQNALRRWKARLMATKGARHKEGTLVRKFQLKYHRAAFFGWKTAYLRTRRLAIALSNYERKTRQRHYEASVKCLRGFARSKGAVFEARKSKGTEDILSLVTQAYLKRLGAEFQRYKAACGGGGQKQSHLKSVFGKIQSQRARDAFLWWRRIHEKAELSQDQHETGPARAEYWRSMREIENMKDFLRQEKYTEDEVEKIYDDVCSRNEGLMRKYILRLKITQQPEKRLLPIVWQRWREFVGIRKLLKYQLNKCQNSMEDRKADMQRAFKKWRNGPDQLAAELWRLPVETLVQLGIRTTKDLDGCGDSIGENSAIQNHLMMQRDEFLNYYIKGQILAMALLKDRAKFVEMQACSRWLWARRQMTRVDFERQIRDAAYLHANLEQQQISITAENAKLTSENKELHQFGQDGSVIRKNKEKLVTETTSFKTRIADTDQDYQELMAQSELLTQQVQAAEAKVAAQSHNRGAFQKLPTLKGESSATGAVKVGEAATEEPETEAEKKQRERFDRLAKLSQGAGLR